MLAIDGLRVSYGRIAALQGISLEVNDGEIVGVIGPNGAGKSTMLLTIAGAVQPESGDVTLEGRSLLGASPEAIVRRGVSLVPEGRRIFDKLTVEENLQLGATIRKDSSAVQQDLGWVFGLFPILETYRRTPGGRLSGGEQQQLAIARALLSKPRVLLLDEPSLGLAPIVIDRVFETLEELRSAGVTILLVEQNASRTVELADRTYILRSGRIELEGSREELMRDQAFEKIYLGF